MKKGWLKSTNRGFTLIQLVMVILIISILFTVVSLQWPATSINLQAQALQVGNDIRYAQMLSIGQGQRYIWQQTSSSTYQITNLAGTAILLPSGNTQVTLADGMTFGTLTNLPNNLIAFDTQGNPYTTNTIPGTALAQVASIPINFGTQTLTIQVNPQTGFVSIP